MQARRLLIAVASTIAFAVGGAVSARTADREVRIALVSDGPMEQLGEIEQSFVDELLALTEKEFDVTFERHEGGWTWESIRSALDSAQASDTADLVLVVGITANQVGVSDSAYQKPTFLPFVFDAQLMGAPSVERGSGVENLNYLASADDFRDDLGAFTEVVPYRHLGLIVDDVITSSIPELAAEVQRRAIGLDIAITLIPHDGRDHDLATQLPANLDAVMLTGLPRMPLEDFDRLIDAINARRLPSYSVVGDEDVARGLLASSALQSDWQRLARRNALNMQAVLLGEPASGQPVRFESRRRLTLNLETARRIGLSPRFDVMEGAVLLNEEPLEIEREYDFVSVAHRALSANVDLAATRASVAAGAEDIAEAKSSLLPQVRLGLSRLERDISPAVQAGQLSERSVDGQLTLSQVIHSDAARTNVAIQKEIQLSREEQLRQARLDVVEEATIAFFNVLRAQARLEVQRDNLALTQTNLELARERVRIGSASPADVYRWESVLADARSGVLAARALLDQSREALNRVLHQPLTERFRARPAKIDEPWLVSEREFNRLVDNPASFSRFVEFLVQRGLQRSPELAQLRARVAAQERDVALRRRAFWNPDIAVSATYLENLDQGGTGTGPLEGESDWNVSVGLELPLFSGGVRRAALRRSRQQLEEARLQLESTRERVEQGIRARVHSANASYARISLSEDSRRATEKNLALVKDSYANGLVSVIDLLDAQNAAVQSQQASAEALADFLIEVMQLQRAVGVFDFMRPEAERDAAADEIRRGVAAPRE